MLGQAQQPPKSSVEVSETLFSVMVALNSCGYDQGLNASGRLRAPVRADVARAVQESPAAAESREQVCRFRRDHQQADSGRDLAQYLSLALTLGEPPAFTLRVKEAELPPDAGYVLGIVPLLQRFHQDAGLRGLWQKYLPRYEALIQRYHDPVSAMLLASDLYLKLPLSGYVGRHFVVYLEPLAAPGQVNARNYGDEYFVVLPPEEGAPHLEQVRHTYLHFLLDPFAWKRPVALKRLRPLLLEVQNAPMEESYKNDVALLVTESLIRAVEARMGGGRTAEAERLKLVDAAMEEGFILTRHFWEALAAFEKGETGLRDSYSDLLASIDLGRERKRAQAIVFRRQAAPEVVSASKPREPALLEQAEQRLSSGDVQGAKKLAEEALNRPGEDTARALFILARAATLNRDVEAARAYFERALASAHEPRLVAWSHIYLGRIFDLQENREAALQHYRAALAAGDSTAETKAAAERGLQQPYEPPARSNATSKND